MSRAVYAWAILATAPIAAACFGWIGGTAALTLALILGRWPAILAALPRKPKKGIR